MPAKKSQSRPGVLLPAVKTVERAENLGLQVYRELRQALIAGAYPPGSRMSTRATAAAMRVSITPAREALGRLIAEGALELTPSRVIQVPQPDCVRVAEIYRIRKALEPMVAEAALPHLRPRDIKTMRRHVVAQAAALDAQDYRSSLANNQRFHFTIYEAAQMPVALRIIEGLWLQCGPVLRLLYPEFAQDRKGVRNHLAMLEAAERGDAAALRVVRLKDLDEAEATLLRSFPAEAIPAKRRRAA